MERVDADEFAWWLAEYTLEPWEPGWQGVATLQATQINLHGRKRVTVAECMPGKLARREQTEAEKMHRLDLFFRAMQAAAAKKSGKGA